MLFSSIEKYILRGEPLFNITRTGHRSIATYQVIKYVPLMYVNGDESLKLGSLHLGEITGRLINQCVKQLQEALVGLLHHFSVILGILQCLRGISSPD